LENLHDGVFTFIVPILVTCISEPLGTLCQDVVYDLPLPFLSNGSDIRTRVE